MEERPGILAQVARLVGDTPADAPLPLRLCRAATEILGGDGGAITLAYTTPERLSVCFTDPVAYRLEDLQDVLGEGPAPDAARTGRIVIGTVPEQGTRRWPMFSAAVLAALGGVTVYAVPMCPGHQAVGVLTIYQHRRRPLARPLPEVQFLSNAIGAAVAQDHVDLAAMRWSSRDQINQAVGMVVAQLAVGVDDALTLLRAHAFALDMTLDQIAGEVVEHRQDLSKDVGGVRGHPPESDGGTTGRAR